MRVVENQLCVRVHRERVRSLVYHRTVDSFAHLLDGASGKTKKTFGNVILVAHGHALRLQRVGGSSNAASLSRVSFWGGLRCAPRRFRQGRPKANVKNALQRKVVSSEGFYGNSARRVRLRRANHQQVGANCININLGKRVDVITLSHAS